MKIVVAIKQVPDRDAPVRIAADAKWIEERELQWAMNEPDAYALEEALQLKEKHGGEVIVLSAGPERVGSTIREALAKGADRAIQIVCDDLGARDALGVARLLAEAIKPENPDLVLTGLQSEDLGLGQTGVILAELLGLPHATLILHVEKTDAGLKVKRELEEGWFQSIEMPLPAVLTMQSGGNKLRYATLMGIKRAKTKELRAAECHGTGRGGCADGDARTDFRAEETKIDADSRRLGERGRGSAGGETENGGAGAMSGILWFWRSAAEGSAASVGKLWPPAASGKLRACAGCDGRGDRRADRGTRCRSSRPRRVGKVVRVRASIAGALHRGWLHARSCINSSKAETPRSTWFFRTRTRCATTRRRWHANSARC